MDIATFVSQYLGLRGKVSGNGWFTATCPLHRDTTPSFGINTHYPYQYNCFGCKSGGQLPRLVSLVLGMSAEKALALVREQVDLNIDYASMFRDTVNNINAVPSVVLEAYQKGLSDSFTLEYCRYREIPRFILDMFGVGHDSLEYQMMIPARNIMDGRVIGFDIKGFFGNFTDIAKLVRVPDTARSRSITTIPRFRKFPGVIVCEGFFDLAKIMMWLLQTGRADYYAPISIIGSSPSDEHLKLLASFDKVVLAMDKDFAGRKATSIIASKLRSMHLYELEYDGPDPGKSNVESLKMVLKV